MLEFNGKSRRARFHRSGTIASLGVDALTPVAFRYACTPRNRPKTRAFAVARRLRSHAP
jgi:hypothetical protein